MCFEKMVSQNCFDTNFEVIGTRNKNILEVIGTRNKIILEVIGTRKKNFLEVIGTRNKNILEVIGTRNKNILEVIGTRNKNILEVIGTRNKNILEVIGILNDIPYRVLHVGRPGVGAMMHRPDLHFQPAWKSVPQSPQSSSSADHQWCSKKGWAQVWI